MEIQSRWTKNPEGFMEFGNAQAARLYEVITDQYHRVFADALEELDDEEAAGDKARKEGYQMITDYKTIEEVEEFATTYSTPTYVMDIWYEVDPVSRKRIYDKGFIRILRT